ncbi:GGDEF domain-containing protein, diguanylate cyclase (c-di-GMP synthetase) or its enzymatically inactive variants [Paenibacillus polysaccharolyticus]|uniref:GGDEF domain-containing protein, diguanylate cyclase (C-di-GMP synthetase) or its enzymatically inactive variants n=1 Tax=Paenibacillus polysaccharolyticus TaxID=582692 RepID=A0A1G5J4N0_9BACL|nr:diguanylate cyclase [Paenibacillus polysaccharolyticus]SCY83217.1 GGDEF domain-containing protein, diguanylate cyclase (c-di-GMP synthetase) or its enzymatically inactive variants [Paenibacillus polysaccharolyticus]
MRNNAPTQRLAWGYAILISLAIVQQFFVYLHLYMNQSYTKLDVVLSIASLGALAAGLLLPVGVSVVLIFVYLVTYFVWLVTFAEPNALVFSWWLLIPANTAIAAYIKRRLVRSARVIERLEQMKDHNPEIDLDTTLGNKEALGDTLVKQSNLARRYSDCYGFSIAMFKIEFLPLVQESLGSVQYSQFLLEISQSIQKQIRYEDHKFFVDRGRFVILCPMVNVDYLPMLTRRIKKNIMDMDVLDKKGNQLQTIIKSGALVFQKEQFSKYDNLDAVLAALERNTETDLIGEYI